MSLISEGGGYHTRGKTEGPRLAVVSVILVVLTVRQSLQNTSQELFGNLTNELGIVVFRTFATLAGFGPRERKNVLPI